MAARPGGSRTGTDDLRSRCPARPSSRSGSLPLVRSALRHPLSAPRHPPTETRRRTAESGKRNAVNDPLPPSSQAEPSAPAASVGAEVVLQAIGARLEKARLAGLAGGGPARCRGWSHLRSTAGTAGQIFWSLMTAAIEAPSCLPLPRAATSLVSGSASAFPMVHEDSIARQGHPLLVSIRGDHRSHGRCLPHQGSQCLGPTDLRGHLLHLVGTLGADVPLLGLPKRKESAPDASSGRASVPGASPRKGPLDSPGDAEYGFQWYNSRADVQPQLQQIGPKMDELLQNSLET
jgi:hypothetical protein